MIAGSQSRYVLQQPYFVNPNGLITSTSNKYGSVDGSDLISSLKSVSHRNRASNLGASVSVAPTLVEDYSGVGKHAMLFNGSKSIGTSSNPFSPEWNEEYWMALAFSTSSAANQMLFTFGEFTQTPGGRLQVANGQIIMVSAAKVSGSDNIKVAYSTIDTYDDGNIHYIICHFTGTDDVNDWVMYVDGVEQIKTNLTNTTQIGGTYYPTDEALMLELGKRHYASGNQFNGHMGKVMCGYGAPNVNSIMAEFNRI